MVNNTRRIYIFLLLFILFSTLLVIIKYIGGKEPDYKKKVNNFIKILEEKEYYTNSILEKAIADIKQEGKENTKIDYDFYRDIYEKHEIAICILKADSLLFWSSNVIPIEQVISDTIKPDKIIRLSNGWYEIKEKKYKEYKVKGIILIRNRYNYQNDYLINEFQKDFKTIKNCRIYPNKGEYNIYSEDGNFLCSLYFKKTNELSKGIVMLMLICYVLAYLFFISFLILWIDGIVKKISNKSLLFFLVPVIIIAIRYLLFNLKVPAFIYNLDIFGPKYYANSNLLPSLGDLLINVITIFLISVFVFRKLRQIKISADIKKLLKCVYSVLFLAIIIITFLCVCNVIKGLIINSDIVLDLNNVFSINFIDIIGFCIVALIFLSFFLLSYSLTELAINICVSFTLFKTILWSLLIAVGAFLLYFNIAEFPYLLALLVLLNIYYFYIHRYGKKIILQAITLYIILFALLSTYTFYKYNTYKEREKRKLLISELSGARDPITEYLFSRVKQKIINDTIIKSSVNEENTDESFISDRLKQTYFNGYWSRYNIQITLCKRGQELIIKPNNLKSDCDSFFTAMINNIGKTTIDTNLFSVDNDVDRNSYIAKIPIYKTTDNKTTVANIYIEFYSKFIPKELGYPELLIDKNIKIDRELYNYSYAKYKNNELMLRYGKYYYCFNASNYKYSNNQYVFFDKNKYNHLLYKLDNSTVFIVSKKNETLLSILASFSYIFVFYYLFVLTYIYILHFPIKFKEINLNFKTRVQISMVFILIVSFVIIGTATLYYIISLYNKKNLDNISEKTHSVLVEMEGKLGNSEKITPVMSDYVAELLTKFSNVFFSDINLYTPDGKLIASSRSQIFDEAMISVRMNAEAYNELTVNNSTLFIHNENIGNLKYLSAYVPFRNNNNVVTGYLNLPYFAKQSELRKEISTFFTAFFNINVIIIALAIIIALIVSNYVTRPMKIIKDKLGQIKLGKKNEKIEWKHIDEIGGLVNEYNRMIDELAESADMLAKSERESAWREMAKQVAHEIKNPLTPMKLSIQHLKKSWEDKTPDWEARFNKFSTTMIEQIESLNKIASEFSDFAKMPKPNNERINLVDLIENATELYCNNNLIISLVKPEKKQCEIYADKTQILRVLNNLLKNSVQALTETENAKIEIKLSENYPKLLIEINDNGIGMNEEQKEKVFSPNFTTKTGGMGLGLAMVKNIVESYGGKIWFKSEERKGTTFYIEFIVL